jgi:hypothetical protein
MPLSLYRTGSYIDKTFKQYRLCDDIAEMIYKRIHNDQMKVICFVIKKLNEECDEKFMLKAYHQYHSSKDFLRYLKRCSKYDDIANYMDWGIKKGKGKNQYHDNGYWRLENITEMYECNKNNKKYKKDCKMVIYNHKKYNITNLTKAELIMFLVDDNNFERKYIKNRTKKELLELYYQLAGGILL